MNKVVALDIGGSNIRVALIKNNKIIKKFKRATEVNKGKKTIIKNILDSIFLVMEKGVNGIGIGMPGPADYENGRFINPPNLKPLWNVNIKKIIKRRFKCRLALENDANCVAIAELKNNGIKNFVILTLGTGIGCGVVIEGKLYKGKGNASESGHMIIDQGKDLEELASGKTIKNKARKVFGKNLLTKDLVKLAKKGDKKAKRIIEKSAKYLGIGLGNIVNIFDPEAIILAGGMKEAGKYYLDIAIREMNKVAMFKCKVRWSKIEDAGLIGAGHLIYTR